MSDATRAFYAKFAFACVSLIFVCFLALFFLVLSWLIGGNDYKDSLFGNYALVVLIAGMMSSFVLMRISRREAKRADQASVASGHETDVGCVSTH